MLFRKRIVPVLENLYHTYIQAHRTLDIRPVMIRVKRTYLCATTVATFDRFKPYNCGGVFTLGIRHRSYINYIRLFWQNNCLQILIHRTIF